MKKYILLLFASILSLCVSAQTSIPYTELNYNVHYHWGLINVSIAHGVLTMQTDGNRFIATLDGNSIPWNGRVFCVSDTLKTTMTPARPYPSERIDYINGWYLKPKTTLYRSSSFNPNDPAFYKNIKGQGKLDASPETMEAINITSDMLSLFYYVRGIDFETLSSGQVINLPFTGAQNGECRLTYNGKSTLQNDNTSYHTYSTTFEYTYEGRMSGYKVNMEVAAESRIPLKISASLPVGHVEMTYHE